MPAKSLRLSGTPVLLALALGAALHTVLLCARSARQAPMVGGTVDVGAVTAGGQPLELSLSAVNDSGVVAERVVAVSSCGCLVVKRAGQGVPPGGRIELEAKLTPPLSDGEFSFFVSLAHGNKPGWASKVFVRGRVDPRVGILPRGLVLRSSPNVEQYTFDIWKPKGGVEANRAQTTWRASLAWDDGEKSRTILLSTSSRKRRELKGEPFSVEVSVPPEVTRDFPKFRLRAGTLTLWAEGGQSFSLPVAWNSDEVAEQERGTWVRWLDQEAEHGER